MIVSVGAILSSLVCSMWVHLVIYTQWMHMVHSSSYCVYKEVQIFGVIKFIYRDWRDIHNSEESNWSPLLFHYLLQ